MEMLRRLLRAIRDTVLPPRCLGCERPIPGKDNLTCGPCAPSVRLVRSPQCPTCALPRPAPAGGIDAPCSGCREVAPDQERGFARWLYDGAIARSIQRAKYSGEYWRLRRLGIGLRRWVGNAVLDRVGTDRTAPLRATAVPMHPTDLRERGFNQAVLLARYALAPFDVPARWDVLRKPQRTRPQAGLTRGERRRNVRGAFEVSQPDRVADRRWLVFDDVSTSGATLAEVAAELAAAGADAVYTVAAARTPRGDGTRGAL